MERFVVVVVHLTSSDTSWKPSKKQLRNATIYGPFDTFIAAESYADYKHCDDYWKVVPLTIAVMSN